MDFKVLLFLLITLLFSKNSKAQFGVHKSDSLIWRSYTSSQSWGGGGAPGSGPSPANTTYYNYFLKGDTTIDGYSYKVLYGYSAETNSNLDLKKFNFFGLIYSDSGKTYIGKRDNSRILMNMNLMVGDSFKFKDFNKYSKVTLTDSILVQNKKCKYLKFNHGMEWVEGIGDVRYGLTFQSYNIFNYLYGGNVGGFSWYATLNCFGESFLPVYGNNCRLDTTKQVGLNEKEINRFFIYPNPTQNKIFVNSDYSVIKYTLLDALGNELFITPEKNPEIDLTQYANGIYFIKLEGANETIFEKVLKY